MNDPGPGKPQAPQHGSQDEPEHVPQAVVKQSRWPGWIWAVPIAALAVVAWLGVRSIVLSGPTVTVTFTSAPGIKPNQTKVQYEGLEVGQVESVTWHGDLQHVDVVLSMHADMDRHLGPGTRYWIAGENFSLAHLSDIKDVVAGPHIDVDPRPGKTLHHVVGLAEPPVVTAKQPGTTYVLHAEKLGSVSHGSQIYYLDMQVGKIEDTHMTDGGQGFDIVAVIHAPYDQLVHTGSRFWNASAVQFATGGAGPSVRFQSLPALFEGAVAFETPSGPEAGPRAPKDARFTLYDSKDAAEHAAPPDGVEYLVQFDQSAGGLVADAPVKLLDEQIGVVREAVVQYDAASRKLFTRATIVVDPSRIATTGMAEAAGATPRARMDALLQSLIAEGLRAQLGETTPVIGGRMVALRFVPHASKASLIPGPVPEIPSTSSSGVQDIMAQAGDVMHKLDAIPLAEIGENVRAAAEHVARLTRSPELAESLHRLDQSLANIERITVQARERVGPILNQVHQVASEAESTLASAKSVFASGAAGQNQPNTAGLPDTLYELARAARSLRELADYLDRHPEALLTGKGKNG
jgi:paraquat-inducible protein B